MKRILLLMSVLVYLIGNLQCQEKVWLYGRVINASDSASVPLSQIASYEHVNLFSADSIGEFKVILPANDSIKIIALGFEPRVFILDSLNIDPDVCILFPLRRVSYQIKQVDINCFKGYNNYRDKLKSYRQDQMKMNLNMPNGIKIGKVEYKVPLYMQPSVAKPSVVSALFQPVSAISYYTSKKEKQRRKFMKFLEDEDVRKLLTRDLMKSVSGLEGEELDRFVIYCNKRIKFDKRDTKMTIRQKVFDLANEYVKLNSEKN